MNARTLLLTPWRACHKAMGWLSLGILGFCLAVAIGYAIISGRGNALWVTVWLYSAAQFYLWAFFLSSITLLAVDARWLCLPGMQRAAVGAVLLYAVLSLLPTLALALLFGGDVRAMCLITMLCILGGLSFALLPRYIAIFIGLLPALRNTLAGALHLPGVTDPRFVSFAATLALILVVTCMLRWRMVVTTAPQRQFGLGSAMVLQYRRSQWSGWGGMNGIDSTQQVRQRPDWMQPRPDLRKAGPQQPDTSMRVALGGWYLPRTWMGHMQSLAPTLLATGVPFAVMFLLFSQDHGMSFRFWSMIAVLMVSWVCMFGSLGVMFMTVMLMQQRWRKSNAELPLLALLPGLGDAEAAKRRLLVTVLRRPITVQILALVAIIAIVALAHPSGIGVLLIVIGQLSGMAALAACLLGIVGGRPLPAWATLALMIAISVLVGCDSFLPNSMVGNHPWVPAMSFVAAVLAAWLIVGVAIGWVFRRSWAAWRMQPHAFMPNG